MFIKVTFENITNLLFRRAKYYIQKRDCQFKLTGIISVKEIKNPWTYVINDLNGEETIGTFYEKELPKTNQKESRIEKVIKKKGNKLYIKCQMSFNISNVI